MSLYESEFIKFFGNPRMLNVVMFQLFTFTICGLYLPRQIDLYKDKTFIKKMSSWNKVTCSTNSFLYF